MKLAVVGSRDFNDYRLLSEILDEHEEKINLIVSGGARGADSLAQRYAKEHGIPILIYYPDWNRLGKQAGYVRNTQIGDLADAMVAFHKAGSKGTQHSIDYMRSLEKPVRVIKIRASVAQ